jgi:hypothetical protein
MGNALLPNAGPDLFLRNAEPVHPGYYPAIREVLPAQGEHDYALQERPASFHAGLERNDLGSVQLLEDQGKPVD